MFETTLQTIYHSGTSYWLFCTDTAAPKPMSWQVNGSCTASLYLFLKGLFEIERRTEREREVEEKDEGGVNRGTQSSHGRELQ